MIIDCFSIKYNNSFYSLSQVVQQMSNKLKAFERRIFKNFIRYSEFFSESELKIFFISDSE